MKIYEHYSQSPDGWNVTGTLELRDGGQFGYSEGWTDYTNASLSGGVRGTWRRSLGGIVFQAEWEEGPMYFPWQAGQSLTAIERGDDLHFEQGWTMSPPTEYILRTPISNTDTRPLTLRLKPWGIRQTLPPGESVNIVAQGRWWEGQM